jgi:methylglutaconyl-CoA hydratase
MSQHNILEVRRDGAVERVVLNRPEVRNAFNEHLIAEMASWAAGVANDPEVHAVVLSGAGPGFCAGADLEWMSRMVSYSREENVRDATAAATMFSAFDNLPVPLITRIHGAAIGGGAGLAAVSDIVVAASNATFGFTEVKLGLVPAIIAPYVLAKIGRSAARELFLTGRRFTAEEARQIGLVHAVVPEEQLDAAVEEYLEEIAGAGRSAVAASKALIQRIGNCSPEEATPLSVAAIAERRVSTEAQMRMAAFLKKDKRPRPPTRD